ncbi:ABC transporter ATP-binding protein [cyanobacterium endosymbiont of Epithemia clementina EcSB]|uniref:ABC transporter ATP-binding protein n=1 Tax=cyanobacterium endosymbiont of Epithemia clementina EcSB TaxID=3034674 RepID=UPI0024816FFB|nr:ATP-binding cassette domain-containing protein [cyanobacterium endosymbiont of Epithemia clementina EcSB]WGT68408.1 ATP-binding cassette domain-containing protein [cyanobacterium endosymbiont of Epithemia clementina EcSB]
MMSITVENLGKTYSIPIKKPGIKGTLSHFFNRTYRQVEAVKDISFTIEPGEIVGFLGANGAGKTTTLKMLSGLIHPSEGKVKIAGYIPFRRQSQFLQKTSLVMGQKQQLLWDLPTLDSLRINGAVYKIPDKIFKQRLQELSKMLSIEDKLTQPVRKLSLGERMKAELLAALLHHPQVLFLDEPTLGLDVNAQAAIREFLRDYNQQYQATILLTSHYMADITALCKRVLLIHQGQLIYDGDLEKILAKFAPYRQVNVELANSISTDQLASYGKVETVDGQAVRFLVKRENLITMITHILDQLEVIDLNVTDPPIEEVIGHLFQTSSI